MALMEAGDLSLDSYPFGGYCAMVDNLYLRKPMVSYQGKQWVNRIGSKLLRQAGLSELISTNANDYAQLAIKLIDNISYRKDISDHLRKVDLDTAPFDTQGKQYFKKAITYLWDNHETLSQEDCKEPIVISQLL